MTIATAARIEAKTGGAPRRPPLVHEAGKGLLVADFEVGGDRLERIEAAVALVKRAMCLAENEGKLGAAFADDLAKAVQPALAGMEAAGIARQAPHAGH